MDRLMKLGRALEEKVIIWRRAIHRLAEPGGAEVQTAALVEREAERLRLPVPDGGQMETKPVENIAEQLEIRTQFEYVEDRVTAKKAVNLRSLPSTEDPRCEIVAQLDHGVVIRRTGINRDLGWSRVDYNGRPLYCITSYLEVAE